MRKIFITGASGFVGTALCEMCETEGWQAIRLPHDRINTIKPRDLEASQGIIYLAGLAHRTDLQKDSSYPVYKQANVDQPLQLAEKAMKAGVSRFIYVSTVKVLGEYNEHGTYQPEDRAQPRGPYARSKWDGEQGLRSLYSRGELIVVRPPLIYGPDVKGNLERLMSLIRRGYPLPFSRARGKRSIVSARNLSGLLLDLMSVPWATVATCAAPSLKANGYPVFLPSDLELSSSELIDRLAEIMGKKNLKLPVPAFFFKPTSLYDRLFRSLVVDASTARSIGWKNRVTPDEALKEMVTSFLAHVSP